MTEQGVPAGPERRRRRPAVSCSLCRKRKLRCNRENPCSNCLRARNGICVYESPPLQSLEQRIAQVQTTLQNKEHQTIPERTPEMRVVPEIQTRLPNSLASSSAGESTLSSQQSARELEAMKSRIQQLEEQLSQVTPASTGSPISNSTNDTTTLPTTGTFYIHHENHSPTQPRAIVRSVTHKTRLFGQSHWINGLTLFRDVFLPIAPHVQNEISKAAIGMRKCKSLARIIKSGRAPPWPSLPTADIPPKQIADELVDCYLRTIETVYRILHVPTFKSEYETLWETDKGPNPAFLVQLKLVLAIGATTYDDRFSMRRWAIRWVYEAQTWLSKPDLKSHLGIQTLQTNILLLLARETSGIGEELIWISAGALLRTATYMGLHRDPAQLQHGTVFAAEMRRRLWNTVLELTLQSSLTSGGPPLISLDDFDTKSPGNIDDDQLMTKDPVPKLDSTFTQMSIAIALRKTFPPRLAATKFLNSLASQGTYEETLKLDVELRASYKATYRMLQRWKSGAKITPLRFETRLLDILMHRYLSALHIPFFALALHETAYAYSRKVVVESSLKILCAAYPSSPSMAGQSRNNSVSSGRDDLERLICCGSGVFRTVPFQASLLIAAELRTQLQEEESLGPMPLRLDYLSILDDAKTLSLQCIEAGETNIKGYLLTCVVAAQIEGLRHSLGKDEILSKLIRAAEDAEETCLPMLEHMAAQAHSQGNVDEPHQAQSEPLFEVTEDWEFMMSDAMFNPGNGDPLSWMFDDGAPQGTT